MLLRYISFKNQGLLSNICKTKAITLPPKRKEPKLHGQAYDHLTVLDVSVSELKTEHDNQFIQHLLISVSSFSCPWHINKAGQFNCFIILRELRVK